MSIEPPFISLDNYCTECNVDHGLHPHPNADPHEPWECHAAEAKADLLERFWGRRA